MAIFSNSTGFCSDDSTLVDPATSISIPSPVPSDKYLWQDPWGRAYPGWHHQLILHLLAMDSGWRQSSKFDFSIVKIWLQKHFPTFTTHEHVLEAIAEEYIDLDDDLKAAYRGMTPRSPVSFDPGQDGCTPAGIFSPSMLDRIWPYAIDPALFDMVQTPSRKASHSLTDGISSPITFFNTKGSSPDKEAGVRRTPIMTSKAPRQPCTARSESGIFTGSLAPSQADQETVSFTSKVKAACDKESVCNKSPTNTTINMTPQTLAFDPHRSVLPSTPTRNRRTLHPPSAPRKRHIMVSADNTKAVEREPTSPTPQNRAVPTRVEVSHSVIDGPIEVTDESAKILAPLFLEALVKQKHALEAPVESEIRVGVDKDAQDEGKFESEEVDAELPPANVSNTKYLQSLRHSLLQSSNDSQTEPSVQKLRKPNPDLYKETSKNHFTIPQSEAPYFLAHFKIGTDPIPEKIEGYFWYCEKCYISADDKTIALSQSSESAKVKTFSVPEEDTAPLSKRRKVTRAITGGTVKGKFSGKRSIQKHMEDVHKIKWTCNSLPESER